MGTSSEEAYQEFLVHHGVRGMKWGVRRTDAQLGNSDGGRNGVKSKDGSDENHSKMTEATKKKFQSTAQAALQRKEAVSNFIHSKKWSNLDSKQRKKILIGAGTAGAATIASIIAGPAGGVTVSAIGRYLGETVENGSRILDSVSS